MTHIINLCIEQNKFPNKWKLAKVLALFKCKGSHDDPKNFGPISILNLLLKVMEKELLAQIDNFMVTHKLWNRNI